MEGFLEGLAGSADEDAFEDWLDSLGELSESLVSELEAALVSTSFWGVVLSFLASVAIGDS